MQEVIKEIINAGMQAPSGENCQPWRFVVNKNGHIRVYNLPERDDSFYNTEQKGSLVAHGALLENMKIAAAQHGYDLIVDLFPDSNDANLVARIRLDKSAIKPDPLFAQIFIRATNRKPYQTTHLSEDERDKILEVGNEIPGGEIKLVENQKLISFLATAVSANERVMFENQALHKFFFSHINWNQYEEDRVRSGFYIKTLELKPPQIVLFKLFKNWSILKQLNKVGFSKFVAKDNAKVYASSAAMGAVIVPTKSDKDFILAGRIMQRLWLRATALGLNIQPATGALFLAHKIQIGEAKDFSAEQVEVIQDAYKTVYEVFGVNGQNIAMAFRLGHGGNPSARSSRFVLESAILFE